MVKLNAGDDGALTGESITVVFKDVGEVSFQGAQTGSEYIVGAAAHAHITDDRTGKQGHMFMVFTGQDDEIVMPSVIGSEDPVGLMDAVSIDRDLVYEVAGHAEENVRLSDAYKLAGKGPVAVYVDSIAQQLLDTAKSIRTDEQSKELILDEVNDVLAMNYS